MIYSADASCVEQEIARNENGETLFKDIIYRLKQSTNGDYVVSARHKVLAISFQLLKIPFFWLRITDEGSVPEMRIWSILLIRSDLKW